MHIGDVAIAAKGAVHRVDIATDIVTVENEIISIFTNYYYTIIFGWSLHF